MEVIESMEADKRLEDLWLELPNFLLRADALEWELQETQATDSLQFVINFARRLAQAIKKRDPVELLYLYDSEFSKLTEHFFGTQPWPAPETLVLNMPEANADTLRLYSELYYRYIHSRAQATSVQRIQAYNNYSDFLDTRLDYGEQDTLALPSQWAWDLIDEFTYQFQAYWQQTGESKGVWNADEVLGYLRKLVQASGVVASGKLREPRGNALPSLSRLLGYFAVVGQTRVLTQLGDYQAALDAIGFLSEESLAAYSMFPAAYVSLLHHAGFSLIMLGRFYDAQRLLHRAVAFVLKVKQYFTRSYQYNIIMKKVDQICSLLAITEVLSPSLRDSNIKSLITEKLGDKLVRMSAGESVSIFEEIFTFGSPKFVRIPARGAPEPIQAFRNAVLSHLSSVKLISFVRIYRKIDGKKLARLMELPDFAEISRLVAETASFRTQKTFKNGFLDTVEADLSTVQVQISGDFVELAEFDPSEDPKSFFSSQSELLHRLLR